MTFPSAILLPLGSGNLHGPRSQLLLLFLVLGRLLSAAVAHAQLAAPSVASVAAPLVFRGVTVIDVEHGQHLANRTVVIIGNRIQRIESGTSARVPAGAQVIDAQGKYLIPGLWDMHVYPKSYVDIAYPPFIANGVTGVRDAGSDVPLATFKRWKQEIAAGTRPGPRLIVSGPTIGTPDALHDTVNVTHDSGAASHWIYVPPTAARRVVDSLHAAGADMLKLYMMPRKMRLAMAAEARRVGIPFGGHSSDTPGLEFSDSGATILDHETWIAVCEGGIQNTQPHFDAKPCAAALQRLRRNGTWVVLTDGMALGSSGPLTWSRMWRYQPHTLFARWEAEDSQRLQRDAAATDSLAAQEPTSTAAWMQWIATDSSQPGLATVLAENKARTDSLRHYGTSIPAVAGTDMGQGIFGLYLPRVPGFSLHPILVGYVLSGMTPLEALQTATLNPARALRATDSLGTVTAGKVADLVLLDADPLADIWNTTKISAVVANGRYYNRVALDGLLQMVERAANNYSRDPSVQPTP